MAQQSDAVRFPVVTGKIPWIPTGLRRSGVPRMMYSPPPLYKMYRHMHVIIRATSGQEQRYLNQCACGRSTTLITNRPTPRHMNPYTRGSVQRGAVASRRA
jgi:hypothetical protein